MDNIKKELIEWVKTIAAAFAIALVINVFGGIAIVDGQSMNPTLNDKDVLIMEKISYKSHVPSRGDIIAFKTELDYPDGLWKTLGKKKNLVKRIIGLPGDKIKVSDGIVYVNGKKYDENYLADDTTDGDIDTVVPEGHLFVMGDNRLFSNDSRREAVGFVKVEDVIGKITLRVFPLNALGSL